MSAAIVKVVQPVKEKAVEAEYSTNFLPQKRREEEENTHKWWTMKQNETIQLANHTTVNLPQLPLPIFDDNPKMKSPSHGEHEVNKGATNSVCDRELENQLEKGSRPIQEEPENPSLKVSH
ncbi:hypothetical protein DINM_000076 [Dirofilaria immitis]|nr:hypothetical protein [Dirofilaria immitis]